MKQRIDKEQLLSLTDEQKDKLRELWEPKEYDLFVDLRKKETFTVSDTDDKFIYSKESYYADPKFVGKKRECLPRFSIGQMIEILNNYNEYQIQSYKVTSSRNFNIVKIRKNGKQENKLYSHELCDALFEALKEVL